MVAVLRKMVAKIDVWQEEANNLVNVRRRVYSSEHTVDFIV
eukprot:COSAG02_NODE_5038_length_4704_cov_24.544243_3_plen_41_part_00